MQRSRITRGEDFQKIVRRGSRVGGQFIVTHAVLSSLPDKTEYGFIVSKRVGNAVKRNLVKRRLTGASYELDAGVDHGLRIVIRAKPEASTASYAELKAELHGQIKKIRNRMM